MKALLILAALVVPGFASAQTARVKAGDHPGFTRLVVDLPDRADWQLGRTAGGYELRLAGGAVPYDLTQVFRVITRDRLASVWADPETGNLQIGVACACHAVPFAFRPDIIVIDLRDGPPEGDPPHERGLDGRPQPMLADRFVPPLRPRPAPDRPDLPVDGAVRPATIRPIPGQATPDNGAAAGSGMAPAPFPPGMVPQAQNSAPAVPFGLTREETSSPSVQGMRLELLQELGRAATAGVIDVDDPSFPANQPRSPMIGPDTEATAHIAIEGLPGIDAVPVNTEDPALTPDGGACLPDSELDIASWGDDRPFVVQMTEARNTLVGEFDRPDPAALARLVRLNLFFGFGAEARNVLASFGTDFPESPLWTAMAHILDDQAAPSGSPLEGQIDCSGYVALWATLAEPILKPGQSPDAKSVALAFSALPLHLRRHLGAPLAEKMLSIGDISTAQMIRDAIWRAPGAAGPAAEILTTRLDRERGNLKDAAEKLETLHKSGGPTAPLALLDLVDTQLALGQSVDETTIVELGARLHENQGTELEAPLVRAEMLALASAGDFETAFSRIPRADAADVQELWAILAAKGQDAALLTHAVLPQDSPVPPLDNALRKSIADRLLGLGFADEALRWLPDATDAPIAESLARAELRRGDARTALRGIAGLDGPEISRLRAEALEELGDQAAAARAFAQAGDPAAEAAALWRAQDWAASATMGSDAVRAALTQLSPDRPVLPPDANAPLAQGRALLEDSAKTRDAILSLLDATPAPEQPQP
ncbi:MAG: hypothetical protein IOC80_13505 [Rhodobacter sp.]|nr:hypothetical protein [Rhodobacter sp.]MCA3514654.1 hypothetical protein [Rhodobacter sp.]MCA3518974.1 hypothetical protein [Rhodobacter sp.]MCA3522714.1 hypothetical protein [Rhodobacter sp.]MCA3526952.1 hypothetical protein [Rhodobacter sp.]